MFIKRKRDEQIMVDALAPGEVFSYSGKYYIRIVVGTLHNEVGAVNLETGDLNYFMSNTLCTKVEMEGVVK